MAGRETPATRALAAAGVAFELREYEHDPAAGSYALEAADALGLDPDTVFKTLVVDLDGALAVCLVPVGRAAGHRARSASASRSRRPTARSGSRATSPAGSAPSASAARSRRSSTSCVEALDVVWVSGGRRGLEIGLAPRRSGRRCWARTSARSPARARATAAGWEVGERGSSATWPLGCRPSANRVEVTKRSTHAFAYTRSMRDTVDETGTAAEPLASPSRC